MQGVTLQITLLVSVCVHGGPPSPLPPFETVTALSDLYAFQCSQ